MIKMLCSLIAVAIQVPPTQDQITLHVDGIERTALVVRPSKPSRQKAAVYFVFHGLGANSTLAQKQFQLETLDPSATIIYADGVNNAPQVRSRTGQRWMASWQVGVGQNLDRDVHFVEALLKWADENGSDPARHYFVGHSNGSSFAWIVLKEIGEKFSKFVGLNGGTILPLKGAPIKPTFLATGSNDRVVPPETVRRFADSLGAHNQCKAGFGSPVKTYAGSNPVYLYEYDGGHLSPKDVYEKAVRFCQTGKP